MSEVEFKGLTVKKEEDFSEWYTQLIQKADLADYSVVSGCIVFKPYSYAIWEKIVQIVDKQLKARGIKNAYFPLFIPERLLTKEKTHIEGFSPEVAWVTHAGNTKLEERLAVRPTSETIMYDSYAKWIRSWRDLPLKLNQWNSVVRWEFKHPVPFLRTREFLWNEGHTAFATKEEAEVECNDILNMYCTILKEYFALHSSLGKKTEKEKFAGAEYTLSCEMFMPNGKSIQGPDSHHDGQNFAKAFDITFLDKEGKKQYVWQNTWAITTRMIGVLIAVHGDNKGLVLPPELAPTQVVIVPILFKNKEELVMTAAKEIEKQLKGMSVYLDDREYSPGWKFNEWELKGVPVRIEIGPKDIENNQVIVLRRDNNKKIPVKQKDLSKYIALLLKDIQASMLENSKEVFTKNTVKAKDFPSLVKAIKNKKLVKAFWCEKRDCEDLIKYKTDGAKILHIPLDQPKTKGPCVYCRHDGKVEVLIGKSY